MHTAHSLLYGGGGLWQLGLPDRDPPWTEISVDRYTPDREPPDRDPPGQISPPGHRPLWTDTPRQRSFWTETPLDGAPLTEIPWTETPRQRPPWTETSWTEIPRQRPPGQRPPSYVTCGACWDREPPRTESQTGVKSLPCPKLRLRVINITITQLLRFLNKPTNLQCPFHLQLCYSACKYTLGNVAKISPWNLDASLHIWRYWQLCSIGTVSEP